MFFGLFKNIDSGLNRKISLDSLLSWTFGVIFVLIGFGLSFSGLMPSLFLFLIAVLLIPPISSFIEKKIKTKLTNKIKAFIIIICGVAFWTTIDTDNQLTDTVLKNTTPNQQEQIMTVSAMQNTTEEVTHAQYASESENTEIILPPCKPTGHRPKFPTTRKANQVLYCYQSC